MFRHHHSQPPILPNIQAQQDGTSQLDGHQVGAGGAIGRDIPTHDEKP